MVCISEICYSTKQLFRTSFQLKDKHVMRWFPGHMGRGVKQMQNKLKSVDCIIEVHDARIPFSGRNPHSFKTISGLRPHILLYNKRDLADENLEGIIFDKHKNTGFENVIFTNCKDHNCSGSRKIIPMVQKLIRSSYRHNRSGILDYCLMVIGVPNVGKSSVINVLRQKYLLKSKAAHVGAAPGITRSVQEKIKISDDPLIYVFDTPGILTPHVPAVDDGMKLALCATIPDKEVGIELIADYLLYWLNKHDNFSYVDFLDIDNPSDSISEILALYAIKNNMLHKVLDTDNTYVQRPNLTTAAAKFVDAFRRGVFGKVTLDIDKLDATSLDKTFIVRKKVGNTKR